MTASVKCTLASMFRFKHISSGGSVTAVTAADLDQTLLKDIKSGSGSSLGFNSHFCIGSFDGKVYFTADDLLQCGKRMVRLVEQRK